MLRPALPLLLCSLVAGRAAGQALDRAPAGAAALAQGGVGAVGIRSPAALFVNPALLPRANGHLHLGLGLEASGRAAILTTVNQAEEARDQAGVAALPQAALAIPLGPALWFSLGYHQSLGVESRYGPPRVGVEDPGAPGRYRGLELSLVEHVWSFALAVTIRERLTLGGAVELRHLRLRHRQALWAGFAIDHVGDARLDLSATVDGSTALAADGLLGLSLRVHRALELGFALTLPASASVDGELALAHEGSGAPYGYTSLAGRGGAASLSLPIPLALRGGIALSVWRLRLLLEGGFERWSSAGALAARCSGAGIELRRSGGGASFVPLETLPLGIVLGDRASARAGLELHAAAGLELRAGYSFVRGASEAATLSSVLLDLDHHTLSFGLELAWRALRVALAFAHTLEASLEGGERATLFNPLRPELTAIVGAGRYLASRTRLSLDLQWRF
jgi:long-subunit fatty acid transport protein